MQSLPATSRPLLVQKLRLATDQLLPVQKPSRPNRFLLTYLCPPLRPRDAVSRTANVERNGGHKWVNPADPKTILRITAILVGATS